MFCLGVISSIILFLIAGFHFYWLFGGTVGADRNIPPNKDGSRIDPGKPITFITSLIFVVAAIIPLVGLKIIDTPFPDILINICLIFGAVVLAARGIGGLVGSLMQKKPRDIFHRWNIGLYTWLCILLALGYLSSYLVFNS